MNRKLRDFLFMTAGTILVAVGLYYFKMPNHFSTGGVSGIAIILGALIPGLSTGTINFIINMLLLLLGFLVFGRGFGAKTAYASMLMSSIVWGLERIQPMDAPFYRRAAAGAFFSLSAFRRWVPQSSLISAQIYRRVPTSLL